MGWQFRKTKTFGGLRLTLGKRGLGISYGKGPLRVSRGADGKLRRTVRLLPGVWRTDRVDVDCFWCGGVHDLADCPVYEDERNDTNPGYV